MVRRVILGVGVQHVAKEVVLFGIIIDVKDGVVEGLGINGCMDGGAVPIGNWLGGEFLLRIGDGGDLGGGCCGG